MPEQLTVADLFCGAGGLSLGFRDAGLATVFAADWNQAAVKTYSAAIGQHVEALDLSKPLLLPDVDVIAGGPPCQGFSSAGMRKHGDTRNSLVRAFADTIVRSRPRAFVFENVEGFLTTDSGNYLFDLLEPVIGAGFRVHVRKVNAANFGVPQHRKRVIVIGGLGWDPTFPQPTHSAFGAPGTARAARHLIRAVTLEEALSGLPSPTSTPSGVPQGHFFTPLVGIDLERAKALLPGSTMRDLPEDLHHASYQRRAFRRVMDGTPSERRGGAPAGIRRLRPDEPSKAITGGARSEFIHPFENRPLTIRECARLQTFPDDFEFKGNASDQTQLIGNAVPPKLAHALACNLMRDFSSGPAIQGKAGALLSFMPTMSDGCSPILRQVTERVLSSFAPSDLPKQEHLWR